MTLTLIPAPIGELTLDSPTGGGPGPAGPPGPPGPPGPAGKGTLQSTWRWRAQPLPPTPTPPQMAVDNEQPSQADELCLGRLDEDGYDWGRQISDLQPDDTIYLQQLDDATSWHRYRVTGAPYAYEDAYEIPVITVGGSAVGTEPADGSRVGVSFEYVSQNPSGPPGPQGIEGPPGPAGPQGATGAEGPQGVPGPEGAVGAQGPQGPQGTTGKGIRILGEVPTPADLPTATNKSGDAYIVTSDGDLYVWSTDVDPPVWVDAGQVVGPQGPTGPEGVQGASGPQGPQGVPGPQGEQGVEGSVGPAGAQGPQGAAGAKGDAGPTGAQGPKGDPGSAGSSEFFYGEGTANVSVAVNAAAAATTVISSGAQTCAAVPYLVEFFCPQGVTGASTTSAVSVSLWDGATDLGVIAAVKNNTNVAMNVPVYGRRRLTPTAGSHTFIVKAFATGNAGALNAGAGGPGLNVPLHLRIVKLT